MKLLVTGGAGYIGSVVTGHLLEAGHQVTVLDDLSTGHRDAVPDQAHFVAGDLTQAAEVLAADSYDGALHFAAKSLVAESVANPSLYWTNNVTGTRTLLDALHLAGVPRLVFSSTAATYGEPDSSPIDESFPTRPTSPYGSSKLAVDLMLSDEARSRGLGAVSLRYFNVAGAWRGIGERHRHETHLIPIALEVAQGRRASLAIYGNDYPTADGTCIRDYIHVADLARAHLLALDAAAPGRHDIYNLGTGSGHTVREVLDTINDVTGIEVPHHHEPRRPGDPTTLVASADRIHRELGWTPIHTLHDMVSDAWAFAQTRPT